MGLGKHVATAATTLLISACGSAEVDGDFASSHPVAGAAGTTPDPLAPPASPTNGQKDGDETDVDCGGASAPKCSDGKTCLAPSDCESSVCSGGTCAVPTATDGVRNGDETDVDCGGKSTLAPKCLVGKICKLHEDCSSRGCDYRGKCALAPSCVAHFGGDTCGRGEVGDADAEHDSCCTSLEVNRPAEQGGAYALDKYLITSGRMRAFIVATKGNVRGWATSADLEAPDTAPQTWIDSLPSTPEEASWTLGPWADGRNGCQIANGTRTYWQPDAVNVEFGDIASHYSQDVLDQKVQSCAPGYLFYAFCAWDGGRLASSDELLYAWRGPDNRAFPWGNTPTLADDPTRANVDSYGRYIYPEDALDNAAYMNAPGRMYTGNGQFGHADLVGPVLNIVRDQGLALFYSGSLEGHGRTGTVSANWGTSSTGGAYGMAGARCAR